MQFALNLSAFVAHKILFQCYFGRIKSIITVVKPSAVKKGLNSRVFGMFALVFEYLDTILQLDIPF